MVRIDLSLAYQLLLTWETAESFPQNGEDGISNPFQLGEFHPHMNLGSGQQHFLNTFKMHLPAQCHIASQCQLFLVSKLDVNDSLFPNVDVNTDVQAYCWLLPC